MINKKLHQFNLRIDNQCDTRKTTETISHLLYDSQNAINIWQEFKLGNEFLWGNPMINIPFHNTLFKSNFIFVNDLFNELGIPLSLQEIKDRTGKNLMFTTYCGLWRALPKTWKQTLRNQRKNNEVFRPPIS